MKVAKVIMLCALSWSAAHAVFKENLIEKIQVEKNRIEVTVNKDFKERYLTSDFFVEYDADINVELLDYSLQIMPFIMNVASIVWISGKDYYVDSMDAKLQESLNRVKQVFKVLYPHTAWEGELKAHKYVDNTMAAAHDPRTHIALLFSGGLDSTCSSYYLADKKQLLITAWGQWDVPLEDENLWQERKNQLVCYACERGHENAFLRSNFSSFLNREVLDKLSPEIHSWRIDTVEGIGWAGLTAPILLLKGYAVLYLASSDTWSYQYPTAGNPYVDNNIEYANVSLKHHLFEFSRLDKINWLCDQIKKKDEDTIFIKACLDRTAHNCCDCSRCFVTACGLFTLGLDCSTFGFGCSREQMVEKTKNYLKNKDYRISYDLFFNIECLRKCLKKNEECGHSTADDMHWLLDLTFEQKNMSDIQGQEPINWRRLDELFPHIIENNTYKAVLSQEPQ